jgi:hypothetical protein
MISVDSIKVRLSDLGYPERRIEGVAQMLSRLQPQLQWRFVRWFETGEIPTLEVEGYNADLLIGDHGMNMVAVFLSLDWLLRDPKTAKASLDRGHDEVYIHIPEED